MNNLIIDEEFEKLPDHVKGRMIREADSVTYSTAFFPDDKIAQEMYLRNKGRDIPFLKVESPLASTGERYRDISVSEANLNRLQELLDYRMHTARNILERGISEETRELYVKYLEMIENEIKKALILE
jgi:hypothetical protein